MTERRPDAAWNLRPPSTSTFPQPPVFQPPSLAFLKGSWHVTHSTLPMWKSKRNLVITYTALDSPAGAIDDLIEYQPRNSDKQKTLRGIDTPHPDIPAAYTWRGKGWLKIMSSYWELLGHGDEDGGWVVTFFRKTLFTPAGIDIYSRRKEGLSDATLARIKAELAKIEDPEFLKLADQIFEVVHDR